MVRGVKSFKSAATIDESDVEHGQPTSQPRLQPTPKTPKSSQTKPQKRKTEGSPEKPLKRAKAAHETPKVVKTTPKPATPKPRAPSGSEEESEEESNAASIDSRSDEETSRSASESDQSSSRRQDASSQKAKPRQPPQANGIAIGKSPQPADGTHEAEPDDYAPPTGFNIVKASSAHDLGNLKKKQLFYITCPSSAPLARIKELTKKQLSSGGPISHNKTTCYLKGRFDAASTQARLLVPTSDGKYETASRSFDRVLGWKEDTAPKTEPATSAEPATKPVVQQPEGLKPRHHPAGFEPLGMYKPPAKPSNKPLRDVSDPKQTVKPASGSGSLEHESSTDSSSESESESGSGSESTGSESGYKTAQSFKSANSPTDAKGKKVQSINSPSKKHSKAHKGATTSTTSSGLGMNHERQKKPPSNGLKAVLANKSSESGSPSSSGSSSTSDSGSDDEQLQPKTNGAAKSSAGKPAKAKRSRSVSSSSSSDSSDTNSKPNRRDKTPQSANNGLLNGTSTIKSKPHIPTAKPPVKAPHISESESSSEDDSDDSTGFAGPRKSNLTIGQLASSKKI